MKVDSLFILHRWSSELRKWKGVQVESKDIKKDSKKNPTLSIISPPSFNRLPHMCWNVSLSRFTTLEHFPLDPKEMVKWPVIYLFVHVFLPHRLTNSYLVQMPIRVSPHSYFWLVICGEDPARCLGWALEPPPVAFGVLSSCLVLESLLRLPYLL